MMTISLETLPLDIVFIIAQSLEFEDVFNLRNSCPEMRSMIGPTILNRRLVEVSLVRGGVLKPTRSDAQLTGGEAAYPPFA